jgi:hypothetical protein
MVSEFPEDSMHEIDAALLDDLAERLFGKQDQNFQKNPEALKGMCSGTFTVKDFQQLDQTMTSKNTYC